MRLEEMPRIRLTHLPTPMEELKNLSKLLDGPRILMKRDDLTSLGMGGNKVRKLEYVMADALNKGAEVIITSGGVQTNHGRLTAAAAKKLGLKPVLILTGEEPKQYKGNLLVDYLFGAELHFVTADKGLSQDETAKQLRERGELKALEVQADYESKGHKCYIVPRGGRMPIATAGYLNGMLEMYSQLIELKAKADYLVVSTGSTSTTSSLLLANKVFNTGIKVIGISVSRSSDECKDRILEELEKDIAFFNFNVSFTRDEITLFDDYIGPGYAIPSQDGLKAAKLLAETEAILVDYAYTGKGMAGLIDLVRKGFFKKGETVLFLHTGGTAGVFALDKEDFERA